MIREAIDTWLERAILALVIAMIAFGTAAFGAVRPAEFVVMWWMILAMLALWLVRIWVAPKFRFLWPPICWAILPFVGYAIWRWRSADVEFAAREEVTQIILCALLLLIVVNNLYGQESIRTLCVALISLGTLLAMYGIFQWLTKSNSVWGLPRSVGYFGRASGSFICPNHFAGFLELILPLALALTVNGRFKPLARIFLGYGAFVLFVGIAASQSRAGWIATAISMVVLFAVLIRNRGSRWIALALLVVVMGAGYWLYTRSVAQRVTGTQISGHERDIRLRLWASAWQIWKENPWVGVGPNHFDFRFRQHREPVDKTQARPGRVHNDYLNTLTDYGLIGFLLILLPLGVACWSLVKCWPHLQRSGGDLGQKKSNRTAIALGASAGLLALAVHSIFDFNMHIPANAFLVTLLLAMVSSHVRFATERYWITARWPVALAASLALLGTLFYLVPQGLTRTREVYLLRHAEALPDGSTNKIALLQKAFAIQPTNFETSFAIGEQMRTMAWTGDREFAGLAQEAIGWFERSQALNKWDAGSFLRQGMCLDWLGKHDEAAPYYVKGLELDPNHWHPRAMMGWHEFQTGNFHKARDWMERSIRLNWTSNPMAATYLALCESIINGQNAPPPPDKSAAARDAVRRALP